MKYAILCNANGISSTGTDGHIMIDGRKNQFNQVLEAMEYKERFKKNFKHKYEYWTHVMLTNSITGYSTPIEF